jgi:hypothetical protein
MAKAGRRNRAPIEADEMKAASVGGLFFLIIVFERKLRGVANPRSKISH